MSQARASYVTGRAPAPPATRARQLAPHHRALSRVRLAAEAHGGWHATTVAEVDAAVERLAGMDPDELDTGGLETAIAAVNGPLRRLEALRTRLSGALASRRAAAAPRGRETQGTRDAQRFLTDELQMPPSQAKAATETGRKLSRDTAVAAALAAGDISLEHARVITGLLDQTPHDARHDIETELVALAARQPPAAIARHGRRLLARTDAEAAATCARRQHARRRFALTDTDDGGVGFAGQLYGTAAEELRTAIAAFTRPDTPDEPRQPVQRYADGFEALVGAALASGSAPTQHGVRPHALIMIDLPELDPEGAGGAPGSTDTGWDGGGDTATGDTAGREQDDTGGLARLAGLGELAFTGPLTLAELRPLLADCTYSLVFRGPDGAPVAISAVGRNVPVALWRVLLARDRGCTWPGCDAPPGWCDVAHGLNPFGAGGKLRPGDAALLCRRHHRRFDAGGWRINVTGDQVTYTRDASRPPAAAMARPPGSTDDRGPAGAPGAGRDRRERGSSSDAPTADGEAHPNAPPLPF